MKNKNSLPIVLAVIILLAVVSIGTYVFLIPSKSHTESPLDKAVKTAEQYLNYRVARENEAAVDLCYFLPENSVNRTVLLDTLKDQDFLDSYQINSVIVANKDLWEFEIIYYLEDRTDIAHNYVAFLDGDFKFIINKSDVPDTLLDKTDLN